MSQLSPIIQQAASNPGQATQLLMAAAQAFSHNQGAPTESRNVAQSVNQFLAQPGSPIPGAPAPEPGTALPDGSPVPHVPAAGVEPGAQSHLPTGIDPAHAAGPGPVAAPPAAASNRAASRTCPSAWTRPARRRAAGAGRSSAPAAAPVACRRAAGTRARTRAGGGPGLRP